MNDLNSVGIADVVAESENAQLAQTLEAFQENMVGVGYDVNDISESAQAIGEYVEKFGDIGSIEDSLELYGQLREEGSGHLDAITSVVGEEFAANNVDSFYDNDSSVPDPVEVVQEPLDQSIGQSVITPMKI